MKFEQYDFLENIVDSLQLPSNITIASLETDTGGICTLEVRGDVRLIFTDEIFRYPDEFPTELKEIIATGRAWEDERVEIVDNNWFEVFYDQTGEGVGVMYDVVDAEQYTPKEIYELLAYFINDCEERTLVVPTYENYRSLSEHDKEVLKKQADTYGRIFLNDSGKPIENEREQEELFLEALE